MQDNNSARGALMLKTTFILGLTPVAALVLAGCSHTTTEREIVTPVPVATAAPPAVIVANAPPPPAQRAEVRPPAPSAGYVWQDGYWAWRNGQYEWVPGYWQATRAGDTRAPRRWESEGFEATPRGGPN
jgi:hypothetical protein